MVDPYSEGIVDPQLTTVDGHKHEFMCTFTDSVCIFCGVSQNTGEKPESVFSEDVKS